MTTSEYAALAILWCFGVLLIIFPEEMGRTGRSLRTWPSSGLDGVHMGAGDGHRKLFVVFDPPWWRIDRWLWWARSVRGGIPNGKVLVTNPRNIRTMLEVRVFEKQATWKIDRFRRKHAE